MVKWAIKVLRYQQRQDFSQISTTYSLERETLFLLVDTLTTSTLIRLVKLTSTVYENQAAFHADMLTHLGQEVWQLHGDSITQAADLGRRKFDAQFGWLSTYQPEIDSYAELVKTIQNSKFKIQKLPHS